MDHSATVIDLPLHRLNKLLALAWRAGLIQPRGYCAVAANRSFNLTAETSDVLLRSDLLIILPEVSEAVSLRRLCVYPPMEGGLPWLSIWFGRLCLRPGRTALWVYSTVYVRLINPASNRCPRLNECPVSRRKAMATGQRRRIGRCHCTRTVCSSHEPVLDLPVA